MTSAASRSTRLGGTKRLLDEDGRCPPSIGRIEQHDNDLGRAARSEPDQAAACIGRMAGLDAQGAIEPAEQQVTGRVGKLASPKRMHLPPPLRDGLRESRYRECRFGETQEVVWRGHLARLV